MAVMSDQILIIKKDRYMKANIVDAISNCLAEHSRSVMPKRR